MVDTKESRRQKTVTLAHRSTFHHIRTGTHKHQCTGIHTNARIHRTNTLAFDHLAALTQSHTSSTRMLFEVCAHNTYMFKYRQMYAWCGLIHHWCKRMNTHEIQRKSN